ncbi:hypothetical protein OF83DRAFT_1089178 [Amylostereum chailletii]|nr:hypothetical protein OF83DRAFT_1089178 [Amylostereum chailletii]
MEEDSFKFNIEDFDTTMGDARLNTPAGVARLSVAGLSAVGLLAVLALERTYTKVVIMAEEHSKGVRPQSAPNVAGPSEVAPVGSAKSIPQVDRGGKDIEMILRPKGWTDAKGQRKKGKQKDSETRRDNEDKVGSIDQVEMRNMYRRNGALIYYEAESLNSRGVRDPRYGSVHDSLKGVESQLKAGVANDGGMRVGGKKVVEGGGHGEEGAVRLNTPAGVARLSVAGLSAVGLLAVLALERTYTKVVIMAEEHSKGVRPQSAPNVAGPSEVAPVGSAKSIPQVDRGGKDIEMILRPKGWTDAKGQRKKGKQKVISAEDIIELPSSPPTPQPSPRPSAPIHSQKRPTSPNAPPIASALDSKKPQIDNPQRISWALTVEELSSKPVSVFHPIKFGKGSSRGEQMGWGQDAGEQRRCPLDNLPNIAELAQRHYLAEETHNLKAWVDFVRHFSLDPNNVHLPEHSTQLLDPRRAALAMTAWVDFVRHFSLDPNNVHLPEHSTQLLDPRRAALAMTVLAEGAAATKDFEGWKRLNEGYRVEVETLRQIREEVLSMGFALRLRQIERGQGLGSEYCRSRMWILVGSSGARPGAENRAAESDEVVERIQDSVNDLDKKMMFLIFAKHCTSSALKKARSPTPEISVGSLHPPGAVTTIPLDPWVTKYIASLVWDVHIYSGDIPAVEVFDPECIGILGRPHLGGRHAWVHVYWRPTQRPAVVGDLVGRGLPDIEESLMWGPDRMSGKCGLYWSKSARPTVAQRVAYRLGIWG